MQKRLCLILAVLLALALCGCNDLPEISDPIPESGNTSVTDDSTPYREVALAYSHDDTLNPFSATTEVNAQLTGLLYQGLIAIGEDMVPTVALAAEVEQTDDTHLTVTLQKGAVFSDGSAVTPSDVTASFKEAKKSERYRRLVQNVTTATVQKQTVVFTLASADPNAVACLTFPVIKASTLTDKPGKAPVGTGLYVVESTKSGHRLKKNPQYTEYLPYETVSLRHLPNRTARMHALNAGEISYCYDDLSEGDIPQVSGASCVVPMNALVYVGVNGAHPQLKEAKVRQALSLLMDRSAITETAYANRAVVTTAPFHPQWAKMEGLSSTPKRNVDKAVTLLDEAGCKPNRGKRLELELIYSTQRTDRAKVADAIRTQLEAGGVAVTLVPLTEEEYLKRLKTGKYDLYVAEIRLTADQSLRPLLKGGEASYGVNAKGDAATAYGKYLAGDGTLKAFVTAFSKDMPYIPVCWRDGLAAYDRRLSAVSPIGYDPYAGFADWA